MNWIVVLFDVVEVGEFIMLEVVELVVVEASVSQVRLIGL